MTTLLNNTAKRIAVTFAVSLSLVVTLALRTKSQQVEAINPLKGDAIEQVEKSADQPLRVLANDDCPFKIIDAKVKEVSATHFRKLTGKMITLAAVSSVPEVTLVNASGKTITEFILVVRNPQSRTGRGLLQNRVSITPGETYVVKRGHFVRPERATVVGENGETRNMLVQPKVDSEQYWLEFAGRSDLYVTVGRVIFDDGSVWTIKEEGDAR